MAELRPKIVKLCHVIGGMTGVVNKIDENAPEYYSLCNIVTDDEADVAFILIGRFPKNVYLLRIISYQGFVF